MSADTSVCLGDTLYGKPKDCDEAVSFLMQLSGKSHAVYSSVVVYDSITGDWFSDFDCNNVQFNDFDESHAKQYVQAYDVLDKAGAYGIQHKNSVLLLLIKDVWTLLWDCLSKVC